MRTGVVALAVVMLALAPVRAAHAQFSFDARRFGMGGVSLGRDGNVSRFNPAYHAVKKRSSLNGAPRISIPIPIGLVDFLKTHPIGRWGKDPMFNPDSAGFNPVALMNLILSPPVFYDVRRPPAPTNNVEFTIGKNAFVVDLGEAKVLIPEQEFGLGTTSRVLDVGGGLGGFHAGVIWYVHYDIGFTLDDSLRRVLKQADSVRSNSTYTIIGDGLAQSGIAPTISYSGRLTHGAGGADSDDGFYLGGAVHYYMGVGYGRARGPAGFTTGSPVFGTAPIPLLDDTLWTSNRSFGTGFGGDAGLAWISGPFEVGLGVNDVGATLTWGDTKVQRFRYISSGDSLVTLPLQNHVQTRTKLPITYVANSAIRMGTGTTVGGDVVNSGRGTVIHVGVEQRTGPFAIRGGVSRDQRKKMQFGFGGGIRLGSLGVDVGLWTHSPTLSEQRAITMATSISIY